MNAPVTDMVPVDRFDPTVLRRYRLRPMACVPEGWLVWGRSAPMRSPSVRHHRPAPASADTAILSINQYRRVTRKSELAFTNDNDTHEQAAVRQAITEDMGEEA